MAWTLGAMLKTFTAVNYNRKRLSHAGQCKQAIFSELVSLTASVTLHSGWKVLPRTISQAYRTHS